MKYEVFYKKTKIGVLEINDKGQHRYTPDEKGIQKEKKNISIVEMLTQCEWRDPIPFFQNRIRDALRFTDGHLIEKQTDLYRMVRID